MNQTSCVFCKIVARQIPATIVFEDNKTIAIEDINPKAAIHYLIIPKKHISDLRNLSSEDIELSANLLQTAKKISEQNKNIDFKLTANNGSEAGQLVFHLHFHFLAGNRFGTV